MPRPSNTAERRRQIVEALLIVMAAQGYERASVAAVAAQAGLVPGLVHYHFGSKLEILVELVECLHERLRARVERFVQRAGADGARERLAAFLDAHVATGADADPAAVACWVSVASEAIREPDVQAVYRRVVTAQMQELGLLVAAARAEAGHPEDRAAARAAAAALYAAIQGAYQLGTAAPGAAPAGFAAPALRRMADALIADAPPEPRRKPRGRTAR